MVVSLSSRHSFVKKNPCFLDSTFNHPPSEPTGRSPQEDPRGSLVIKVMMTSGAWCHCVVYWGEALQRNHERWWHRQKLPRIERIERHTCSTERKAPTSAARQPLTQSRDHSGIFWSAQANSSPTHWVFRMEHGDILISEETSKDDNLKGIQAVVA